LGRPGAAWAVAPVLVIGIGNPSRGDDALGPACIEALEGAAPSGVELLTDFQLQVEHVLDLSRCSRVVFVDASIDCANPFSFEDVEADMRVTPLSHALSPAELLGVYRRVHGTAPPPAKVLAIRGYEFQLGDPLSAAACANLQGAVRFLVSRVLGTAAFETEAAGLLPDRRSMRLPG
jgi:hydrogenase maturation protease